MQDRTDTTWHGVATKIKSKRLNIKKISLHRTYR